MEAPPAIPGEGDQGTVLVPAAGGRLGFAGLSSSSLVRIWETQVGAAEAAAAWEEPRSAKLLLPARRLMGSVESTRSLLIGTRTGPGPISLNLESGKVKTLPKPKGTTILIRLWGSTPREMSETCMSSLRFRF